MTIIESLKYYFGYHNFRPGQNEIIEAVLSGRNVLAVLPTGAGKSLCYQVPALVSDNFSIVISPLIALMKDQVDSLNKRDEIAAFINSTMSFSEAEEILQKISFGKIKLLYVAPERLEIISFAEKIKKLSPIFLFVDEAHCISEWGHNFRPSYRKIKDFLVYTGIKKISAFTATATPEVVKDIINQLELKNPEVFVKGFERNNLCLNTITTNKKKQTCLNLLIKYGNPAIVYTASRKKAEEVSDFLNMNKINCEPYHAGLAPEIRKKVQDDFINGSLPVIAATNAFGMGIDKNNIRLIIHYNTPGSIENYYQEIGRAGRDGKTSFAFLLHNDRDIHIQNYFLSNSHPDKELIHSVYNCICDYNKIALGSKTDKPLAINYDFINSVINIKTNKALIYSVLKILESSGYLQLISEYDRKDTIRIIYESGRLKQFVKKTTNNNLKETILLLLKEFGSLPFTTDQPVSVSQLSAQHELSEQEIDEALTILDNLGVIEYNRTTTRENFILTQPRIENKRLNIDHKKIYEHYLYLKKKLDSMIDYVFTDGCLFKFILNYFGEDTKDYKCGKCDRCLQENRLPDSTSEYLKDIILRTVSQENQHFTELSLMKFLSGEDRADFAETETFGSCSNFSRNDLKIVLRTLFSHGELQKKKNGSGFIFTTEKGSELLSKSSGIDLIPGIPGYEENLELFNLLKEIRSKASKKYLQSAYLICNDQILKEIVSKKPVSEHELLNIPGFNTRMFNKVGRDFIEVIKDFTSRISAAEKIKKNSKKNNDQKLPVNLTETYKLLIKGYNLADIAKIRKISEAVLSMQIETILEYFPQTSIDHLINKDTYNKVVSVVKKGFVNLKDLKQKMNEEISYPLLRIAVAKHKFTFAFSEDYRHN